MGVVRRMIKNTASLTTAKIISLAASMVFSIFAARTLGDQTYGTYAFIMVLISYFMVTSEYGLETLIVRDVADNKENSEDYICSTIAIKTLTSILSLLLLIVSLYLLKRQDILSVSLWAGLGIIPFVLYMSIDAAFRAHEEMQYIAIIEMIYAVIRASIGILIVINTTDLAELFKAFLVIEILRFALGVILYRSYIGKLRWRIDVSLFKRLFKDGFSMAYWKMLGILYSKVDMLILSIMIGDIAVGWFKVARNITDMISIGSVIILNVLMPVMTVIYTRSREEFRKTYIAVFKYIVIIMLPVTVLITAYSGSIIMFMFGEQYQNSVLILQLLIWAAIANFLLALIGTTIVIIDKFKIAAKISIFTVALRIIITVYLVNAFGYLGACYAAIIISIISMLIYLPVIYREIGRTGLEGYWLKLAAVLTALSLCFVVLRNAALLQGTYVLIIFVLGYLLILLKLKVINHQDINLLRQEA